MIWNKDKEKPARGRPEEINELIRETYIAEYASMVRYAHALLEDRDLAETAVQEAFIVALRKPEAFAESPNPVGWLYKALRHMVKHIMRDRQKLLLRTVALDEIEENKLGYEDSYPAFAIELPDGEDARLLTAAYVEGIPIRDLAKHYGISEGACKMRLKRARERISKNIL